MKNLKNFILGICLMMCMSFGFSSCVNHDIEFDQNAYAEAVTNYYQEMFVQTFGEVAESQTWGFGTSTMRGVTSRAASTWTDGHSCDFEDVFDFEIPAGATEMTAPGWLSTGVYVIPTNGSVSLGWANFNAGDKIYVLGNVTELKDANYNGVVTFYNVGTLTYSISSGSRHTIINTGTLTINSYGNVGEVYNKGTLNLVKTYNPWYQDPNAKADIPDAMSIYSNGEGVVMMPDGGDFKAAADIHGTLVANGNTKIQNSKTQHICGVKIDGILDMTQGHLEASNIEATEITFDGAEIWLTKGGHIKADVIRMPNSATAIHTEATSTGLIEVKDIYFQNTNNFDASFSSNIYFKVTGEIDFSNSTKFGGGAKHYANVDAYNAENTTLNGYNGENVSGTPECGDTWTTATEKFVCRVFAEDLTANTGSDFDFNDVVFDVYEVGDSMRVEILAAGGQLGLEVEGNEIHGLFGFYGYTNGTFPMLNTYEGRHTEYASRSIMIVKKEPKNISIKVNKAGIWVELTAEQGQAAAKFATNEKIDWCNERENIDNRHDGKFSDWVRSGEDVQWWK